MSLSKKAGMKAQASLAKRARSNAAYYRSEAARAKSEALRNEWLGKADQADAEAAYRDSEYERIAREPD